MSETVAVTAELGPYLVWTWHYGSLSVDDYGDLGEAVGVALAIEDHGEGVLHEIEGPDGPIPQSVIDAAEEERRRAYNEERAQTPTYTHRIDLRTLDGERSAPLSFHTSREDADAEAERLRGRFGDRLTVRKVGP